MVRVTLLVIRGQFPDSDGEAVSVVELRVDADTLPPRPAAEQHHLADIWWNCNTHPARPFRAITAKKI